MTVEVQGSAGSCSPQQLYLKATETAEKWRLWSAEIAKWVAAMM